MNITINEEVMELITTNPMKCYVVLKVLAASSLYSVTNKVHPEQAIDDFILEMFDQVTEYSVVDTGEVN